MRALFAVFAALALIAVALYAWNSSNAKAPHDWPAGTVLAVDELAITAEDVDRESIYVERIEPGASEAQLRRLALTNIVLPRVIARLMDSQGRERARELAETTLQRVQAGELVGPPTPDGHFGELASGGWQDLGILVWGTAMDLENGQWSGLVEDIGRFFVLRRLKRTDGPLPIAAQVEVDVLAFPWLPTDDLEARVERAHDEHRLTIVDPTWRAIVPEQIQYRMGVHK